MSHQEKVLKIPIGMVSRAMAFHSSPKNGMKAITFSFSGGLTIEQPPPGDDGRNGNVGKSGSERKGDRQSRASLGHSLRPSLSGFFFR